MDDNQTIEYGEPGLRTVDARVRFDFSRLLESPATWILVGAILMYYVQRKKL